jgi:hypothetical protein
MATGPVWTLDLGTAMVSVVLTAWVFALYLRRATSVKSKFSVGLALLSGLLFAQSLTSVGVYYHLSAAYSADVAIPLLAVSTLDLASFIVLIWIAKQ